ncbi:MAG TPA: dephospho-CoA kinase [Verrucomicrobiae bacterium]|jgi:dephospho-CoA kinase|nr:dephospho-CoA kinase [Verrucomicrobiae bacterium]
MRLYGLTGGIGMGKSTSEKLLRERGVAVIDTDLIARKLVEPGQPALVEIQMQFGQDIISPDGWLRRDELGRRVFRDPAARQKLEAILHPRIREIWTAQVAQWRAENLPRAVVVIPLLYETNAEANFDAVVCVACSARSQQERLQARGLDDDQIQKRIAAQWPVQKKLALSDFVVWTEGQLEVHAAQLERIIP